MTYQIDTCRFLARCSALFEQGTDWLAQCQNNVTQWDIGSGLTVRNKQSLQHGEQVDSFNVSSVWKQSKLPGTSEACDNSQEPAKPCTSG